MARLSTILLVGLGAFLKSVGLQIMNVSARLALLFGAVGLLFIVFLFLEHPELTDDAIAVSVSIAIASFWAWSRILAWVMRRSRKHSDHVPENRPLIVGFFLVPAIIILLYLGPTFFIAGMAMTLFHLNSSAQVAFSIAKNLAVFDGIVFCGGLIAVLVQGSDTVPIQRASIAKIGQSFTTQPFQSIYSFLRQAFR